MLVELLVLLEHSLLDFGFGLDGLVPLVHVMDQFFLFFLQGPDPLHRVEQLSVALLVEVLVDVLLHGLARGCGCEDDAVAQA